MVQRSMFMKFPLIKLDIRLQDKYDDALILLDKALAINPKHVNSLSNKDHQKDLTILQSVLIQPSLLIPLTPSHYKPKGYVQVKSIIFFEIQDQKKYREAVIYYEKSLKYKPNDKWVKNQKDFCEQKLKE